MKKHHTMKRIREWNFLFVLLLSLLNFGCSSEPDGIVDPVNPDIPVTPKPDENKPEQNMNFQFSVEGVDKPYDFYNDCSIVSPFDEVKISSSSKTLHTEKNGKVQTFYLGNDNDEIYLISRVSDTKANKDISFDIRNTAMAYVTLHPFFAHVDSTAYLVLTEAIGMNEHFTPLCNEVSRLVKQKKDLYAEDNTQLMQALNTLLDDMIDLSSESRDSLAGSRAVDIVSLYYPLKVKSKGNRVQLQVHGLSPNYYGTVKHANGKSEKIVVESHDNFGGYLDFMMTVKDAIQQNGFESHYGDVTEYAFPEDGEAKFDFTCRGVNGNVDIATRIASDILDALGVNFPGMNEFASLVAQEVLVECAQTINDAFAVNGEFTMGVFPYFTGDIGENIGNILEFATTISIKTAEKVYEKLLDDQFKYATTFKKEALAKRLRYMFKAYGIVSSAGNMIARICKFCNAPENINFNLCCYQSEVSNCSTIGIARGNNQAGIQYAKLKKPISVFVSVNNEMTDDYLVAFEVTEGGGSVGTKYAGISGNMAETEWTLGSSSKAQKVQAYLCDKTTHEKRSKVVEFEAIALEQFEIEIAGGDEQTGEERKTLPEKLQVSLTDHDLFDTSYYRIKFEVWEGSGSVSPEYAELANGIAQCEWTLGGHDEEEQVVRAVLVSASTQEELSEPVYFDAYTEEDEEELREALVKLYNSTNGDNWTNNDNWCSDKPVEEWCGVAKDGNGKYGIALYNNNLTGKIDQEFPECVIALNCNDNQLTSINVSGSAALERILCDSNQLVTLDVSNCSALKTISFDYNQLFSLDVSGCLALQTFEFYENQLVSLDVSGCLALQELSFSANQLTSLKASECTSLKTIDCKNCQLTSLNISGCTSLKTIKFTKNNSASLEISNSATLENLWFFDSSGSAVVSDCASLKNVSCRGLTSFTVLNCAALEELNLINGNGYLLTSLKVSGCPALQSLACTNFQLTSLDVTDCSALQSLSCNDNQLTSFDVTGCPALQSLSCSDNQLTSLDVTRYPALQSLDCDNNSKLTSLNVIGCSALQSLYCRNTQLTSLDVSNLKKLTSLDYESETLTSINAEGCVSLKSLIISEYVNSVNLLGCTSLESLSKWANGKYLTPLSLNVSGCISLAGLDLFRVNLTSLNVSGCVSLENIDCSGGSLTSLDVSNLKALKVLTCTGNLLTSLNVSGCSSLESLQCSANQLTSLDVTGCPALKYLYCYNNQLTSLNVSSPNQLVRFNCTDNKLFGIVPDWVKPISDFIFDKRYSYRDAKVDGEWVEYYRDYGIGWWYEGEPHAGSKPDPDWKM